MSFRNTSVSLSEHFVDFANEQVSSGRYGSISEVVRAGLRLLEEREFQLRNLKDALAEGDASGVATDFDFDTYVDEIRTKNRKSGA
jgi:antitoxin ParD1/3/4